jgi:hypothetical protein
MAELFVSGTVSTVAMLFGSDRVPTAGSGDSWREKPETRDNVTSDDI